MFAPQSAAAYARVGIETNVSAASPHELILMLFDGALVAVNASLLAIETGDTQIKITQISRAIEIISRGLQMSLDRSTGELADRLYALYEYMCLRLTVANAENNPAALNEVQGLLRTLRDAWAGIGEAESTSGNAP